jgi:hypothetical protein
MKGSGVRVPASALQVRVYEGIGPPRFNDEGVAHTLPIA